MKEFYLKDKNRNIAFCGIVPNNDIDCPPFDYFRYAHALNVKKLFEEILKIKCPNQIPEEMINKYVLEQTDSMIAERLSNSSSNPKIHQIFIDNSLSCKQQNKLLKDVVLSVPEILWMNKEAQDFGYLLDIYHEETIPDKFNEKHHPICYQQKKDGSFDKIGQTEMSDGEMRALLEQRKVVQARIYHKENYWHCFYFTLKGLSGQECGVMGSKPHYHYLSDKSNITLEDIRKRIKDCNMPSSKIHILIDRL